MAYLSAIVFGIIGLGIGILIPKVSIKLIDFKLTGLNKIREKSFLDRVGYVILIAVANGLLWSIIGLTCHNILSGILMSCIVSLAIIFSAIDLLIHIIPNELLIVAAVFGVAFQLTEFGWMHLLIAFALYGSDMGFVYWTRTDYWSKQDWCR